MTKPVHFKRTSISAVTDALVNNSMQLDRSGDSAALSNSKERWEDLTELCNEVGGALMELLDNVAAITAQPGLQELLGEEYGEFTKHVNVFYKDTSDFTERMSQARAAHEGKEGPIDSLDDMAEFARLSMLYLSVSNEINQILGLSVASMFLMLSEAESRLAQSKSEAEAPAAEIVGHPV